MIQLQAEIDDSGEGGETLNSAEPQFIPSEELKKHFGVFGHFYDVELPSKEVVQCRSVLEIVAKTDSQNDHSLLSIHHPDAIFIMMNPGSSRPLSEVSNRIRAGAIHKLEISLVPTKPDTTQYQVMRLMLVRQWRHVRVLNLSDIRSPKSPEFIKHFRRLESESDFQSHSIFADARREELAAKLPKCKATPFILAWGLSEKLNPLIERCLAELPRTRSIKGLLEPGTTNKYRHPLPSLQKHKREWLERMVGHFEE